MRNKKGEGGMWDLIVKLVIGVLVLVLVVAGLYFIISKDLFGIGNFIKNLFRFGP